MPDVISIPLSKKKVLYLLLIAAAFIAGGIWMLGLSANDLQHIHQRRIRSLGAAHGLGVVCIALGGLVAISVFSKLFDNAAGFVLNREGLIDNTSFFGHGFIAWSEIARIEVRPLGSTSLMYLILQDPEQYFARLGRIKRTLYRLTPKLGPSPIVIAWTSLEIDFDELNALISTHLKAARAEQRPQPA